ncbi:hypothetical protein [Microlunatus parietis]|uniref:hypothetical protein n=1 Tax=Microlunatus parietis TaxID=682979 RepID=UPI0015CEB5C8|nr:hypothetical protein [Microlunatus parietis]
MQLIDHQGRRVVEKRMADPDRHGTEVVALRALADADLPVPELVEVKPGSILMTYLPGERLDSTTADERGVRA